MAENQTQLNITNSIDQSTSTDSLLWLYKIGADLRHQKIPQIRRNLDIALSKHMINAHARQRLCLSCSEILSNLIEHPEAKATEITLSVYRTDKRLCMEIKDNSTPFIDFEEKAEISRSTIKNNKYATSGRGLGMVTTAHQDCKYECADRPLEGNNSLAVFENVKSIYTKIRPQITEGQSQKKKIFIIDDDFISLQILKKMLEDRYNVIDYLNAQEALDSFETEKPDLVISDLIMPIMDGAALRQKLSEKENGNTTPFVFLSAHKNASDSSYINQLGIDDFIFKPVKKHHLQKITSRLLSRTSQLKENISGQFGKDITKILKPALPEVLSGWGAAVKASVAETGGGDFILHSEKEDGTNIILSDVMGHGLQAKFFAYAYAGYLRSFFRLYSKESCANQLLTMLSNAVYDDSFLSDHIVTCLSLFIKPNGEIDLSTAGHPWPLLASRTDKTASYLKTAGPLIGLTDDAKYETTHYKAKTGDRIILYTDGLLENKAQANKHQENQLKLLELSKNNLELTLFDYTNNLWEAMNNSTVFQDDTTLVVLEYTSGDHDGRN